MSKKAKIITFSALAALLVIIITVTLLLVLLPSGKLAELETKEYDDFRAALGDYRIASEGGQVYLYKNGGRVSRGYYDITILGYDRGIKEKDSEIYFGVKLNSFSGLGIMNKKGKLLTAADKQKSVFEYGAFESLTPLYDNGIENGSPFSAVKGFLGETKDGKFCYVSADGSKSSAEYDEATLLSRPSVAFIGKKDGVEGQAVYTAVSASGSAGYSGPTMPDYSERYLKVDNTYYFLNGSLIGKGERIAAVDNVLVYRDEVSRKLILADLVNNSKAELSQEATFGEAFKDGLTVLEAGKYSFYPVNDVTGLSSPIGGFDGITYDAASEVYIGAKTDKLDFWTFETEFGALIPTQTYIATGLPNFDTDVLTTAQGRPYVCHKGDVYEFYSDNKKISSADVGTGTVLDNSDGTLIWQSNGATFVFSVFNNEKLQCDTLQNNILTVKNGGKTVYYAAPAEALALNRGKLDELVTIASVNEGEVFTGSLTKVSSFGLAAFGIDREASLFLRSQVQATCYEITGQDGKTEYMLTLNDGVSVYSLKLEGESGDSLSVADGAFAFGKTLIKPRVEAGKLVGFDTVSTPLQLGGGTTSVTSEKGVSRIVGSDEYGKYGAVDENGEIIVAAIYDSVTFAGDVAIVEKNGFYALLDPNGTKKDKLITDFIYSSAQKREGFIVMRRAGSDYFDVFGFDGKPIAEEVIEVGTSVPADTTYGREINAANLYASRFTKSRKIPAYHISVTDKQGKTRALTIHLNAENIELLFG